LHRTAEGSEAAAPPDSAAFCWSGNVPIAPHEQIPAPPWQGQPAGRSTRMSETVARLKK